MLKNILNVRPKIEINLEHLHHNLELCHKNYSHQKKQAHAKVNRSFSPINKSAVVKANAYGLGINAIAPYLNEKGVDCFFVSDVFEALVLRQLIKNQTSKIYVLNGFLEHSSQLYLKAKALPVIKSSQELQQYNKFVEQCNFYSCRQEALLNIDTGISRFGIPKQQAIKLAADDPSQLKYIGGFINHFISSFNPQHPSFKQQVEDYQELQKCFVGFASSIANSAASLNPHISHLTQNFIRPGIAIYGAHPFDENQTTLKNMYLLAKEHVAILTTPICQIYQVSSGTHIGYGAKYMTTKDSTLAILSYGYADGYPWIISPSNSPQRTNYSQMLRKEPENNNRKKHVFVNHHKVPILGNISMDITVIDITGLEKQLKNPQPVEIFGLNININTLAEQSYTIPHDILTKIGHRVSRIYYKNSEEQNQQNIYKTSLDSNLL